MFNKYAEYEKRRRTYLACRGVLRIKQADAVTDAVANANARGDAMADRYYRDAAYDRRARAASIAGRRAGNDAARGLRAAGSEAGAGFDAMGRDIGSGFEHNGGFFENLGGRAGDLAGRAVRGAGEGIRQGANYLSSGAYGLGRGALGGLRNAGAGLVSGLDRIGTGMSNGLNNWMTDLAKHPGANALGLGAGIGMGYLGNKAGRNIADALGMDQNGWKAKALRWGLAGLSGLGGYWAGTGFGKNFGNAFARGKAPVDPRDEVTYKPNGGNNMSGGNDELLSMEEMQRLGVNPDGSPAGVRLNADPTRMRQQLQQQAGPTGLQDANGNLVAGNAGKKPFGRVNGHRRRFGRAGT